MIVSTFSFLFKIENSLKKKMPSKICCKVVLFHKYFAKFFITDLLIGILFFFLFIFIGFNIEATFTMTARGFLKLTHNDYEYTKNYARGGTTFWRCVKRRTCRGKAMTRNVGHKEMMKIYESHSHGPNYKKQ